jgi:hypothetical protein
MRRNTLRNYFGEAIIFCLGGNVGRAMDRGENLRIRVWRSGSVLSGFKTGAELW